MPWEKEPIGTDTRPPWWLIVPCLTVLVFCGGMMAERWRAKYALARAPAMCDDEGCPHHGIPHYCINNQRTGETDGNTPEARP